MKKIFFTSAFVVFPLTAQAEINLDIAGYFRGYGVYADSDAPAGVSERSFEFRRNSEIHLKGETKLDNGLTVGYLSEIALESNDLENESYLYLSGDWGRVNAGSEDGAAYLLQVAAPSADSNIDGMRNYIQGINRYAVAGLGFQGLAGQAAPTVGIGTTGRLDYDHGDFSATDRLTYFTPKLNGFQVGLSYAPTNGQQTGIAAMDADNDVGDYENLWETAVRYEWKQDVWRATVGAGYSSADIEAAAAPAASVVADGIDTWNISANVGWKEFSFGLSHLESATEVFTGVGAARGDVTRKTTVAGAAWDPAPYHVGVSYLDTEYQRDGAGGATLDIDRLTAGAGYTYGPGMSLRAAVAHGTFDTNDAAGNDNDFTQVTLGTDIQF